MTTESNGNGARQLQPSEIDRVGGGQSELTFRLQTALTLLTTMRSLVSNTMRRHSHAAYSILRNLR